MKEIIELTAELCRPYYTKYERPIRFCLLVVIIAEAACGGYVIGKSDGYKKGIKAGAYALECSRHSADWSINQLAYALAVAKGQLAEAQIESNNLNSKIADWAKTRSEIVDELEKAKAANAACASTIAKQIKDIDELKVKKEIAETSMADLKQSMWRSADGSCLISAAARGAEWRATHAGLWSKHLCIWFNISKESGSKLTVEEVGHAVFILQDTDGRYWLYSNDGGSTPIPKGIEITPMGIARWYYGSAATHAEWADKMP